MTSIILAQKFIKNDRPEFENLRRQQAAVTQEKHKMVNVLKAILDQELGNNTCRLCLKPGGRAIFNGGQDFDVALNIRYILGIEIIENDGKPQHICERCEVTVRRAARLKQTAEATQWRLQQEQEMVAASPQWGADVTDCGWSEACDAEAAREWPCRKCRKTFRSQEELKTHEERPFCRDGFVCESCGLELKTLSRLKRHRMTHSGARPHSCAACPYRARSRPALAEHARRHAGLRPLRCARCPAAFAAASALASHRRSHRAPQHACRCGRAFTFRAALQNHIATQHSNAKPFNCGICGKAFATRKMMLRHELKVHNRPKMRSGVMPTYMRQDLDT